MGRETYKNTRVSSDPYVDLAGNTMYLPNAGELQVPTTPFESRQQYNIDGTLTSMPAENARLSYSVFCDICGVPVDSKDKLTKIDGRSRCKECIDEQ